jgi:Ulp1 family protease
MKSIKITVLDSMGKGKLKKDYAITIYLLLELTNLIFHSGSIEFEANDWKTVISSDCLQQNDGHNCCIFVILNLAAIFIGNQLLGMKNPEKVRHWIYEIVKNFKTEEVRMPRLRNLPIIKDFKIDKVDIPVEPTFNYISKIIGNIKNQKSNKMFIQRL